VPKLRLSGDFDFAAVAARTPGFVGADLQALTKEAAAVAVSRIFSSLQQQQPLDPNLEGMQVEVGSAPGHPAITRRATLPIIHAVRQEYHHGGGNCS
jgi:ribosome biogenesis ATPase